ncbi:MAG TPA: DNA polymerase I [Bacteroidales bacterium]|nr:DNA polymerase I [Bacteroidales bacterium]
MNKIFLLDAYALIFRSYYAFIRNPRINSKGLNTSAIFGFTNTLQEIITKEKPTHIAVVFDPPGPTFRNEMYKEYKANREATPEDIKKSIPFIKSIIEAYNIPVVEVEGFEADDVIGSLANKFAGQDSEVFMMTPDKDFTQLVNDKIKIYKPSRSGSGAEILDVEKVKEKFGVKTPLQVIDILALWGDSSDNVPGAPGIGEKTSKNLIGRFGSVENLLENINKLSGKQRENVINNKEQILLSKKLVTIETNVKTEIDLDELRHENFNEEKLSQLFLELEFKTLRERVISKSKELQNKGQMDLFSGDKGGKQIKNENKIEIKNNYKLVDTQYLRSELIKELNKKSKISIYFLIDNSSELLTIDSNLVGMALAYEKSKIYFVAFPDNKTETIEIIKEFAIIFENDNTELIGHDTKSIKTVLNFLGINLKNKFFDTEIAHYLIQPEQKHDLLSISKVYLAENAKLIDLQEDFNRSVSKKKISLFTSALDELSNYACAICEAIFNLNIIFITEMKKMNLYELFVSVEMPLVDVLAEMELTGMCINTSKLEEISKSLQTEVQDIENDIYSIAGSDFNIASPKQLGEILFEKLKISNKPPLTKTKQYATGEEILLRYKNEHPIIDKILDYRGIRKLLNTYVDVLPRLINPKTGRIHTTFNQTITSTGRLSSINPNLQNIPIREERGKLVRAAFVACDEEHVFFSADYSQIELRIMAHLSKDKNMIDAFIKNKEDIHRATAAKIFKVDEDKVNTEMRSKAKTANFGIIYGISAFGLSQRLNISRSDAKELIDSYFESFPGVKAFMDKSIEIARKNEYVETILGRRRYLPDINSRNAVVRGFAERNAINAPIQGSAADIIKIAMINIYTNFLHKNLKSEMILQVHDELNFNVLKSELEVVKEIVITEMQNAISLSVPLVVSYGLGSNWLEAH